MKEKHIYCNTSMACLLLLTPFLDLEREWEKQIKGNDSRQCVIILPQIWFKLQKCTIYIYSNEYLAYFL